MIQKTYLGDGAFINQGANEGAFIITAENGIDETDHIYLDNEVAEELLKILAKDLGYRLIKPD